MRTNRKKDLEKWRPTFFQLGMITALALSLLAFEWKTLERGPVVFSSNPMNLVMEEIIPVTIQKPHQPPVPKPVVTFTQVDDKEIVIDVVIVDAGDDHKRPVEPYVPFIQPEPEPAGEDDFFRVVEKMPSFPGGLEAMHGFLRRHIRYPEIARHTGISGVVHVGFIVDVDGRITRTEVLRGIGGGCDEEALRVVQAMPAWEPGEQRGKAVRVAMSIPVRFVLL